jgi:hypothetical protein
MTEEIDLDALADDLADFAPKEKAAGRSAKEERVIAGFEDIQRFVTEHGREPRHGADRDIFERLYAVRLDRLRALPEWRPTLEPLDHQHLLQEGYGGVAEPSAAYDLDDLAADLAGIEGTGAVTELRHVRSTAEKRAAEEIARRDRCEDFDRFKALFTAVQRDLETGVRSTRPFVKDAGLSKSDIVQGQFFVVGGQIAYVAKVGDVERAPNGETDARLRVVYSNGTESNLLLRSLQRALYKDDTGGRITEPDVGPLFAPDDDDDDQASGTIYVLRSKSDHPLVVASRGVLHKIGVTGGDVSRRLGAAKLDPTFLMADVEIVATYSLFNINRAKLEALIHRVFDPARLEIEVKDRFGNPVIPREWFLVPLFIIDEAVLRIKDGTITDYVYDPATAALTRS